MSENHESNGPDNSESLVNQEGEAVYADNKDDLFVDAPDDLDDFRNADNKESVASNETEISNDGEITVVNVKANHFVEADNGAGNGNDHSLVDELECLRQYKEERESFARELPNLWHQLKVLSENDGGSSDISEKEGGESEGKSQVGDAPSSKLMSECSLFLRSAAEVRLKSESAIRELNAVLSEKDREIDDLNAKVAELSVSRDVAAAYLNSVASIASEGQLENHQYVEAVADRMLSYLAMLVYQEELLDNSVSGKITQVEKSTYMLIERYNQMLYEIHQLGQCFSKTEPDLMVQEQFGTVFAGARDELLELRRREAELVENVSHLEDTNRKLVEQVEKEKEMVEAVNEELSKTKTELEQEKMRCANTKEKLSLAVTKGKALVQQRDSLKQSLAEKTIELEKCLAEVQEKCSALQAAKRSKEELIKSQKLVATLQETLQQSNLTREKSEEVLSQTDVPEEIQPLDMVERIKWLVNERNELKVVSLDFYKLKDAVSLIDVPETVSSSNLESRLGWLKESFYQAKDEANLLLDQLDRTKEAARNEIDRLSASLSSEIQEKDYIKKELSDLQYKYEEIVKKVDNMSLERDHMVRVLLEESGVTMEDQDVVYQTSSDLATIIYKCIGKIREQTCVASDTPVADTKMFERMQSLLYVKNQDLILCEQILEEETLVRLQLNDLSDKLRVASEELDALKEEKDSLQKDLGRSEEKSALLREKLSMAVKKGKGLVQDRENLKLQLDEKKSEIEKLRLNLQQQELKVSECRDQINRLSTDLECIPKLEADLVAMKDQRDQLEQFLLESNSQLQKVIGSVDHIVLPVNSAFREPLEKVNWISGYIIECQDTKTHLEQELGNAKDKANALASKLAEAQGTMKSLKDALSVSEEKITELTEGKREVEVGKKNVAQELEKAIEEAHIHISKFAEACASKKSLEDELSAAESNMSILISEKEEAQASRAAALIELEQVREESASQISNLTEANERIKSLEDALSQVEAEIALLTEQNSVVQVGRTTLENELQKLKDEAESQVADAHATIKSLEDESSAAENKMSVIISEKEEAQASRASALIELEQVREEFASQTSKLTEANERIKSLEDALSQVETDIAQLTEKNSAVQVGRATLENELQKLKDEAEFQAVKLADADATIKSLEDMLLKAENDISVLEAGKRFAEQEVSTLNSKLNTCKEELAGTNGSLESRSVELVGHLNDLQMLMKDQRLLSTVNQCFEREIEGLQNAGLIIEDIRAEVAGTGSVNIEGYSLVTESFANDLINIEIDNAEETRADSDNIPSCFRKTAEMFQMRNKILTDKFERFSTSIDEFIAALLRKLQTTREEVARMTQNMESLRQHIKSLEEYKQGQEEAIGILQNDVTVLLSACNHATRELQFEVKNNLLELNSVPELEKLNHVFVQEARESGEDDKTEHQKSVQGNKCAETAEKLLISATKVQTLTKLFEMTSSVTDSTIRDLQKKLQDTITTSERAIGERDLHQNKVSKLENDVDALEQSCRELRVKLEDCQAKEESLKEKEEEISLLHERLSRKEQEAESLLLSPLQMRKLIDKISGIEILYAEPEGDLEPETSANVKKLFSIIDSVTELQDQINLVEHEKGGMQSLLSTQTAEIEHLKGEVEAHIRNKLDLEKIKLDYSELMIGLEKIVDMLGGNEFIVDKKTADAKVLLSVLEKQIMTLNLEAENSKSKIQELGVKLLGSQKVVDELTAKVNLLEGSPHRRTVEPDIVQERSIFEAPSLPTGSEISEIEDVGTVGQKSISPVPSAAHVRTMRKGSTDHLAINIDSESARLINNEETDEDKGHVFKSLNTSRLVPKQGKMFADRIDGIWVSGGRVLMSRPGARLGLIAYWLFLHIWLLGTFL